MTEALEYKAFELVQYLLAKEVLVRGERWSELRPDVPRLTVRGCHMLQDLIRARSVALGPQWQKFVQMNPGLAQE